MAQRGMAVSPPLIGGGQGRTARDIVATANGWLLSALLVTIAAIVVAGIIVETRP